MGMGPPAPTGPSATSARSATHGVRHLLERRGSRRPAPVYAMAQQRSAVDDTDDSSSDNEDVNGLEGSAEDEAGSKLVRRQGTPLPYDSDALKTLLYNAAWRKAEDGSGANSPAGEATARELVRTMDLPLRTGREQSCALLCEQLSSARKVSMDRLEVEYNAQSKILERKGATPEALLARLAAMGAKLLTEMHDEVHSGVIAHLEGLAKQHNELLSIVRGKTDRMIGELIQESKEDLHHRHGWRSAEVAKKLVGAQMAARSAADAEWRHKLQSAMQRERALMEKVSKLTEANLMLTATVTARNADEDLVRNSPWFKALRDDYDALRGMLADTEVLLTTERRLRLAAEKSDKHNAEDARKLAELRRRLASGAQRAKRVEQLLCASDGKVGLGMAEAGALAAKDRRAASSKIAELEAQLAAVQGQMTTAEEKAEQLKKLKEAAEAAHAQARQELRRLSSAGVANPNFPAGMQRGAVNKTLNPPLFRTSLTAAEASLLLRRSSGSDGRRGSMKLKRAPRPGSQLSDPSAAWSDASASSVELRPESVLFQVVSPHEDSRPLISADGSLSTLDL